MLPYKSFLARITSLYLLRKDTSTRTARASVASWDGQYFPLSVFVELEADGCASLDESSSVDSLTDWLPSVLLCETSSISPQAPIIPLQSTKPAKSTPGETIRTCNSVSLKLKVE